MFHCGLGFPKLESGSGSGDGSTNGNNGHVVNKDNCECITLISSFAVDTD